VFDFAPERDDAGVFWASFSAVDDSKFAETPRVTTHLARSDDLGLSWVHRATINDTEYLSLAGAGLPVDGGVWENEVSRLRFDPYAPEQERWVLLWHRSLSLPPPIPRDEQRRFEHGWVAMRLAPTPEGPWSAERKLFAASGYLSADDGFIGPPEVRMADVSSELADCDVVTEPGIVVRRSEWLVSLQCAGANPRIILLRRDRATRTWSALGSVLSRAAATPLGFDSFSASELVDRGGRTFLLVSPSIGPSYRGCHAYELTSLSPPQLSSSVLTLGLGESTVGFAGACGWVEGLATGVIQGQAHSTSPSFRLVATFREL